MALENLAGLEVRPPLERDIPQIVELWNTCSLHDVGFIQMNVETLRNEWRGPKFNPQTDVLTIWTTDGQAVGYVEVLSRNSPPVQSRMKLRIHPAFRQDGIGEYLLKWAEQRVRQELAQVPDDVLVVLTSGVNIQNAYLTQLFTNHDFQVTRHFWDMLIELDRPIPEPKVPPGIELRMYNPDTELPDIASVHHEAFKDHWGNLPEPYEVRLERWQHVVLDPFYDPSLWFVAAAGEEIAAIAICFEHTDDDPNQSIVAILGVQNGWRKQGLGLALLHHAFREFQKRGVARVTLGVDAANLTGATRLYERAGMHRARQFDHYEKIIRPGRDLRNLGK